MKHPLARWCASFPFLFHYPFPFPLFILRLGSQSYVQSHSEPFDKFPVPPLEQRTYD